MKIWGPMTLAFALGMFSCADKKNDNESTPDNEALQPLVTSTEETEMEIDATSRTEWVGLDLDQGAFIPAAELANQTGWDLAFKRTSIKMNGSVSMQVIDKDFDALTEAPQAGYVGDQPSTESGAAETAGLAFHNEPAWYSYDITTHAVSSRGLVYVIKSSEGRYFKLKIKDYYNAARLPAYIHLELQEVKGVTP